VSSEGGPLLIADRAAVVTWRGADGDGTHYDRACQLLESTSPLLAVEHSWAGGTGVLWEMPTGSAEVWRVSEHCVLLSRPWLDPGHEVRREELAVAPFEASQPVAHVEIASGWMVVAWSAEDASDIGDLEPADAVSLNLSVSGAGVVLAMPPGTYECAVDEVTCGGARSVRCRARAIVPGR